MRALLCVVVVSMVVVVLLTGLCCTALCPVGAVLLKKRRRCYTAHDDNESDGAATGSEAGALMGVALTKDGNCVFVYWVREDTGQFLCTSSPEGEEKRQPSSQWSAWREPSVLWEAPTTCSWEKFHEAAWRFGSNPGALLMILEQPALAAMSLGLCSGEDCCMFSPLQSCPRNTGVKRQHPERRKRFSSKSQ